MNLIRWADPRREVVTIQDEVNRLFDSLVNGSQLGGFGESRALFAPPVDIQETPEEFILRADLPGVSQKDVKVSIMGDTITIRGERKQETRNGLHRLERAYGTFERSFTLGSAVRSDNIQATYRDGVLEVKVPKAEEAKVREVEVQVGS